ATMELAMENLGSLHGVPHSQSAELLSRRTGGRARTATWYRTGGDYRAEHSLAAPLHPAMSMSCESPSGMSLSSTYTTLTPLQHLPPISTVSEKFHHPHHHHHHHHPHQRLAGNVSGSFTLMRDERSLASMGNLYSHYPKDMPAMGQPLSPLPNGLGSPAQRPAAAGLPTAPGATCPTRRCSRPTASTLTPRCCPGAREHLARGLALRVRPGEPFRSLQPKKQRLVFTDLQRRTLIAIFKENKRPSKEMQMTISQQLGLELNTVSNFFMNARRRCMNRWQEEPGTNPGVPSSSTSTFSKA
uniref:One cut homeobox 3 n=1 Tax=Strigops habroptila TaxID=2489341 RepID=A0A672U5R1_STRHB